VSALDLSTADVQVQEAAPAKQAECAVCFEPLLSAPVAGLWHKGQRTCCHFFHLHCVKACPETMGCPLCRVSYSEALPVPPLSKPEAWFQSMDLDQDGRLGMTDVLRAVSASLPVDYEALEEMLPVIWAAAAGEPESLLGHDDMFGPDGLLRQLQESLRQVQQSRPAVRAPQQEQGSGCPQLHLDKRGWFAHWDTDDSGVLEREEVVRGLAKAFRSDIPARICKKRLRMRCIVEQMWPLVDFDGNDRIALDEFCKPGGLADLILERFQAVGSTTARPQRIARPRVRRRRPRTVQRWSCCTDLSDDGRNDRPLLLRRPALGFASSAALCPKRRTMALFAAPDLNLNKWALLHGTSPLQSDQEPLTTSTGSSSSSNSSAGSDHDTDDDDDDDTGCGSRSSSGASCARSCSSGSEGEAAAVSKGHSAPALVVRGPDACMRSASPRSLARGGASEPASAWRGRRRQLRPSRGTRAGQGRRGCPPGGADPGGVTGSRDSSDSLWSTLQQRLSTTMGPWATTPI